MKCSTRRWLLENAPNNVLIDLTESEKELLKKVVLDG